jgi:hypothetical protein
VRNHSCSRAEFKTSAMSWLSPKHLDDASRILRGVALVLAKAAIDRWGVRGTGHWKVYLDIHVWLHCGYCYPPTMQLATRHT